MTALIGTAAQFRCAGTGDLINWRVDGILSTDNRVTSRGIYEDLETDANFFQSTLTVPAIPGNNNTSVQCVITSITNGSMFSAPATLTVLPGLKLLIVHTCRCAYIII